MMMGGAVMCMAGTLGIERVIMEGKGFREKEGDRSSARKDGGSARNAAWRRGGALRFHDYVDAEAQQFGRECLAEVTMMEWQGESVGGVTRNGRE